MSNLKSILDKDHEVAFGRSSWNRWWYFFRSAAVSAGFRAVMLFRLSNFYHAKGRKYLSALFHQLQILLCGADLDPCAHIGSGLRIPHPVGVVVGGRSRIGQDVTLMQGVTLGGNEGRKNSAGDTQPVVGDRVHIGAGAIVLGPVRLGAGCVVAAGAVVVHDVPENAVAAGVPARIIKMVGGHDSAHSPSLAELAERIDALERRLAGQ